MKLIVLGHNVNTDLLHPPRYFSLRRDRVREGFLRGLDPDVAESFRPGDIIVAGSNFGCGSSRETTVQSMLYNGVTAVISVSFARIFYRNAINNGLPVYHFINEGDYETLRSFTEAELDLDPPALRTTDASIALRAVPDFVREIIGEAVPRDYATEGADNV